MNKNIIALFLILSVVILLSGETLASIIIDYKSMKPMGALE